MKACRSHTVVNEKRKTEKSWTLFYLTDYFSALFYEALENGN